MCIILITVVLYGTILESDYLTNSKKRVTRIASSFNYDNRSNDLFGELE